MAPRSNDPQTLFDGAMAALNKGDAKKAARLARKLSKAAPLEPGAWELRATVAREMGAHGDAISYLNRALKLAPENPGALNNLGGAYRETGRLEDARRAYTLSLKYRPEDAATALNLGEVCEDLGDLEAAETAFRAALAEAPDNGEALLDLAGVLIKREDFSPAEEIYERLTAMGHDTIQIRQGRFQTTLGMGRIDDAEAAAAAMRALAPDDPKYQYFTSILHLLQGRWREGWEAYAARWRYQPETARPIDLPWWDGAPLAGRTLAVWGDQGIGDEVMFAAMVRDIDADGGHVVFECDARLRDIFERSFPGVEIVAQRTPPDPRITAADIQIPSSDLCQWYRANTEQFGAGDAYLVADADRARALHSTYREKFGVPDGVPLVGLAWQSLNPEIGAGKSITLDLLEPVLALPDVRFFNLQYGDTAAQRETFRERTGLELHHDPDIDPTEDLDGHLAQIAAMDLVVSISNTTVHLAGAIGVPVWVIVKSVPDRRWMMDRVDSPFYRAVRLFRQPEPGNWAAPIDAVREALAGWPGNG